ncbi:hypothetical protein BMR1_01G01340 [Babesia microti strain RI]|uniref:RRM domain-containing protein n=1 Tax=Babesia microti (strain RI) TaxID=1133968 RepID=A0A1N6LWM8_BABMR|nr:hypothetical protein BMR1_01G01340 [Babesia microti strain RI]SIO73275.1 hypothetical protein BMR1_01G01340 [Babesia microti strain RI]|eukprot:XP_012647341.2 hypothetical protein BMR1_01G01340 [Babesia microti strain RI]
MVESNNLIVFPLSPNVTNDHLIEIFSNYGTILNATITNETQNGGFKAIVTFSDKHQAEEARNALHHGYIDGNVVKVRYQ